MSEIIAVRKIKGRRAKTNEIQASKILAVQRGILAAIFQDYNNSKIKANYIRWKEERAAQERSRAS